MESEAPHLFEVAGPPMDLSSVQTAAEPVEDCRVNDVPLVANPAAAAEEVTVLSERAGEASGSLEDVMPAATMAPQPLKRMCVRREARPRMRQSKFPSKILPCSKTKTAY